MKKQSGYHIMFGEMAKCERESKRESQESAMFECFETPEEWRVMSVQMKQFEPEYIQ